MQRVSLVRNVSNRFTFPASRCIDLNRNFRALPERERKIVPKKGYFPLYEPPSHPGQIESAPTTVYRQIEAFVRLDRRAFLRRVRRAEHWIPGFLQGRGKEPDVLLRVPLKPIGTDYNAGLYALQKRGKVKFCGPLYELIIRPDPEGYADNVDIPEQPVRVQPMGMLVHPISDKPVGLNFVLRPENEAVRMRVPIRYINEEKCVGLRTGGWVNSVMQAVDINVAPGVRPPLYATQDLADLKLHGKATIGELTFERKGEGCRTVLPDDEVSTIISKC